jgi:hypothetical protein
MTNILPSERSFDCEFCQGVIKIPYDLAPTKAPCPYCGEVLMSPAVPKSSQKEVPVVLTPVLSEVAKVEPQRSRSSAPAAEVTKLEEGAGPPTPAQAKKPVSKTKAAEVRKTPSEAAVVSASVKSDSPISSLKDDKVAPGKILEKEEVVAPKRVSRKAGKDYQTSRKVSPMIFFAAGVGMVTLAIVGLFLLNRSNKDQQSPVAKATSPEVLRNQFLREGWKESASEVMSAFLSAETVEEKARYVVDGEARHPEMTAFYRNHAIEGRDTPLTAFSHEDLVMEDKERGLFLMRYDRPAQFAMSEFFRPVAPIEVERRVEPPSILLALSSNRDDFAMDPVRILAFLKDNGGELRLDWDVYVQTKYRLLKEFLATPQPGERRIFRVRIHEDVPSVAGTDPSVIRHYRCVDPAHDQDFGKIPVVVDSALGRHLANLNWVGVPGASIHGRGATLELAWTDDGDPRVYIKRLLCWEYLGLGGVMGNLSLPREEQTAELELDNAAGDR